MTATADAGLDPAVERATQFVKEIGKGREFDVSGLLEKHGEEEVEEQAVEAPQEATGDPESDTEHGASGEAAEKGKPDLTVAEKAFIERRKQRKREQILAAELDEVKRTVSALKEREALANAILAAQGEQKPAEPAEEPPEYEYDPEGYLKYQVDKIARENEEKRRLEAERNEQYRRAQEAAAREQEFIAANRTYLQNKAQMIQEEEQEWAQVSPDYYKKFDRLQRGLAKKMMEDNPGINPQTVVHTIQKFVLDTIDWHNQHGSNPYRAFEEHAEQYGIDDEGEGTGAQENGSSQAATRPAQARQREERHTVGVPPRKAGKNPQLEAAGKVLRDGAGGAMAAGGRGGNTTMTDPHRIVTVEDIKRQGDITPEQIREISRTMGKQGIMDLARQVAAL